MTDDRRYFVIDPEDGEVYGLDSRRIAEELRASGWDVDEVTA